MVHMESAPPKKKQKKNSTTTTMRVAVQHAWNDLRTLRTSRDTRPKPSHARRRHSVDMPPSHVPYPAATATAAEKHRDDDYEDEHAGIDDDHANGNGNGGALDDVALTARLHALREARRPASTLRRMASLIIAPYDGDANAHAHGYGYEYGYRYGYKTKTKTKTKKQQKKEHTVGHKAGNKDDSVYAENTRLRARLSALEMGGMELAALRERVADLEWALDVVREDADRVRDDALALLLHHGLS